MSAHPGTIEVCEGCPYEHTVCDSDCGVYQDLEAEYKMEMAADFEHDRRKEERIEQRY